MGTNPVFRIINPLVVRAADNALSHHDILDAIQLEEFANFSSYLRVNADIRFLPMPELRPGVGRVDHAGADTRAGLIIRPVICQSPDGVNFFCLQYVLELIG